jgi:hypothetical protein
MTQSERREKALERLIARELRVVVAEEALEEGLRVGRHPCPKCGRTRGWLTEESRSRWGTMSLPTFKRCACGDVPDVGNLSHAIS